MSDYTVYMHTSPSNKVYIGITGRKPEVRWARGKAYRQNERFSAAISKYGWDNFKHEILYSGLSKEEACEKEVMLIALYHSNDRAYGYNNSVGGEFPATGRKASEAERQNRSRYMKEKKMTPETCAAISRGKKGRPNGLAGRTGEKSMQAGRVIQIDEETGKVIAEYYGYPEMHRATGFALTPVKEAVYGIRKRAYGYLWRYEKRKR